MVLSFRSVIQPVAQRQGTREQLHPDRAGGHPMNQQLVSAAGTKGGAENTVQSQAQSILPQAIQDVHSLHSLAK